MANQQFCLRWNNYQTNLTQVFDQLLQTESFVDVTLACEGHSLKAHRMVLSACSPYFQELLSDAPCSHPCIILQGVKWTELKAVVEFMYKGEININQDDLGSMLRVAEYLKIRGLAEVDGDPAETAVLTSPSISPAARALANALIDESPVSSVLAAAAARKRRRLSGGIAEDMASRPTSPLTPTSAPDIFEHAAALDLPNLPPHIRGGGSAPLPGSPAHFNSLPSPHLPGHMPPPQLPPHLPHLSHLPPLSPLLNMHSLPRPHLHDDFEIRPGIAEMIREEERRRRDAPDMAKLLESSHHWMGTTMADGGGGGGRPVFPTMFADPSSITSSSVSRTMGGPSCVTSTPGSCDITSQGFVVTAASSSSSADFPHSSPSSSSRSSGVIAKASKSSSNALLSSLPSRQMSVPPFTDAEFSVCNSGRNLRSRRNTVWDSKEIIVTSNSSPLPPPHLPTSHTNPRPTHPPSLANTLSSSPGGPPFEETWESFRGAVSGPKSGPSRWTQSDLMAALSMVKSGTPIKPAAERCNIPVMTLWRRTRALGIVSSKVQCGFRYPAARKRPKHDSENDIEIKMENDTYLPSKLGDDILPRLGVENKMMLSSSRETDDSLEVRERSPLITMYGGESPKDIHINSHFRKEVRSRLYQEFHPDQLSRENSPSIRRKAFSAHSLREDSHVSEGEFSSRFSEIFHSKREDLLQPPDSLRVPQHNNKLSSGIKEASPYVSPKTDNESSRRSLEIALETATAVTSTRGPSSSSSSSTATHTLSTTERPDRFCAWVDIVLEGASGCRLRGADDIEEVESPEDLSRHPVPPSKFNAKTTSTSSTSSPSPASLSQSPTT